MKLKVVILCGGMGTRLREETEYRPKPMVEVGGKPILWHIMKIYDSYGFKDFVLCLGYRGDVIKDYFLNYEVWNSDLTVKLGKDRTTTLHDINNESDWNITLADTGDKTLKGGRLKKIQKYISDDVFMVTYGDGVGNVNITQLLNFHTKHGKVATVTGVRPPSLFGELLLEGDRALSFSEKPQTSTGLINGGFFVFNQEFFDYLSDDDNCDLERGPLETLTDEGELMVYVHDGLWACMDTYRDVDYLNRLWWSNEAFWKVWR